MINVTDNTKIRLMSLLTLLLTKHNVIFTLKVSYVENNLTHQTNIGNSPTTLIKVVNGAIAK